MYSIFGFDVGLAILTDVSKYNPETNTWQTVGRAPTGEDGKTRAVTHYGAALVDDEIWILGGRRGNHPGKVTDKVWRFNLTTNSWAEGPNLPFPAGGGGAGRLGNKVHYVGGFDPDARKDVDAHLVYDLDAPQLGWQDWSDRSPMPLQRNHFGAAALGGKLYCVGGQNGHDGGGADVDHVHAYDPITDSWERLADLPSRESHIEGSTFSLDGMIYVFGGQTSGRRVLRYDPATDSWSTLKEFELPRPLLGPNVRVFDQTAYVSAGGAPVSATPIATVWAKDFPRTPLRELRFNPGSVSITLAPGVSQSVEALLVNLNGELSTAFQLNAADLPSWLSVENPGGALRESFTELNLNFAAGSLAPGTYATTLTASASGYTGASLPISLTVTDGSTPPEPDEEVLYRINAGSNTQVVAGTTWARCSSVGNCGNLVAGGFQYREGRFGPVSGVPENMNQDVFKTEWTGGGPAGGNAFSYNFPVPTEARYKVILYFAELNKFSPGLRLFDVVVEGNKVLENFDVFVEAGGANKAFAREFTTEVTDGLLEIDFVAQKENAKISAIQIVKLNKPPEVSDFTVALEAECATVGENWIIASDDEATGGAYAVVAPGLEAKSTPPQDVPANHVSFEVTVPNAGAHNLLARVRTRNASENSFWVRVDDGDWIEWWEGIITGDRFDWREVLGSPFALPAGPHRIDFAFRERGAELDRILLTNTATTPQGPGPAASVECSVQETFVFEAECSAVGSNWDVIDDDDASRGSYVAIKNGFNSLGSAPEDVAANQVNFTVDIEKEQVYNLLARIQAPTGNDDSFWVRLDGGEWIQWWSGLRTGENFAWRRTTNSPFNLTVGNHAITIAYREDGTLLDKVMLTPSDVLPPGNGPEAPACATAKSRGQWPAAKAGGPPATLRQAGQPTAHLYPNPVSGELFVSLREFAGAEASLIVVDALGRPAARRTVATNTTQTIPTHSLRTGAYYLRVVSDAGETLQKQFFVR